MRMLEEALDEEKTAPCLDFCFIDGGHTWETDGFAFFLVDRLLRPGRWIVLDDIEWSFADSPSLRDTERVWAMTEDESTEHQVRKVVDLLVRTTPGYEVRILGNIAFAFIRSAGCARVRMAHHRAHAFLRELASSGQCAAS